MKQEDNQTKNIEYESNGAKAVMIINDDLHLKLLLNSPHQLEILAEEVREFRKHFWDMIEEDWASTSPNTEEYYFSYFRPGNMLIPVDDEGRTYVFDEHTGKWVISR